MTTERYLFDVQYFVIAIVVLPFHLYLFETYLNIGYLNHVKMKMTSCTVLYFEFTNNNFEEQSMEKYKKER